MKSSLTIYFLIVLRSIDCFLDISLIEIPSTKKAFLISSILVIVSILRYSLLELGRTKRVFGFGRAFNGLFAILGISSLQKKGADKTLDWFKRPDPSFVTLCRWLKFRPLCQLCRSDPKCSTLLKALCKKRMTDVY